MADALLKAAANSDQAEELTAENVRAVFLGPGR